MKANILKNILIKGEVGDICYKPSLCTFGCMINTCFNNQKTNAHKIKFGSSSIA